MNLFIENKLTNYSTQEFKVKKHSKPAKEN